jgi:hypothetical protein
MIAALALAAALLLPAPPGPAQPAPSITTTVTPAPERQWAIQRPTRGAHARAVQRAATIPPQHRQWAACVLDRESGGTLDRPQSGSGARNPASSAQGRWQFLNNNWQRGLSFMVRDRLVQFEMPKQQAAAVRRYLGARPIASWDGWYQDIGFNEVVERGGAHHWNGGSHSC